MAPRKEFGFRKDLHYMPAFHPAFVLRQPWQRPLYHTAWKRGIYINGKPREQWEWQWPRRVYGDQGEVARALWDLLDNPTDAIALDVETSRADSVFDVNLHCVGVGTCDVGITASWPLDYRIEEPLRKVLASSVPKVLQNANFDLVVCERNGLVVKGEINDTLPAGCIIHPHGS